MNEDAVNDAVNHGPPQLRASGIRVTLGGAEILHGVDVEFRRGTVTALLGANGAGKTTLIRTLFAVVPATAGEVEVAGRPLASYTQRELARTMALVPQETYWDLPFTVRATVMMGRYSYLQPLEPERPVDHAAVADALERFNLTALGDREVGTLSSGERQRVLIARALVTGAKILIGDEPVSHLDIGHRLEVLETLRNMAAEGFTVVLALHDLDLALRFADHTYLLDEGRVAASGDARVVLEGDALRKAFGVEARVSADGGVLFRRL